MIYMTYSFSEWCFKYHRELYVPLMFGHVECLNDEVYAEYLEWARNNEGKASCKKGREMDEKRPEILSADSYRKPQNIVTEHSV